MKSYILIESRENKVNMISPSAEGSWINIHINPGTTYQ